MAVPRLTDERCFLRLDPARLGTRLAQAATIKGAARLGEPVTPRELEHIDKLEGMRRQELSADQLQAMPVLRRIDVRRTAGRARRRP
jgi:hypothetical protein